MPGKNATPTMTSTLNKIRKLIKEQISTENCKWLDDGLTDEEVEEREIDRMDFYMEIPNEVFKAAVGLEIRQLGDHYTRLVLPSLIQKRLMKGKNHPLLFDIWADEYQGRIYLAVAGRTNLPKFVALREKK